MSSHRILYVGEDITLPGLLNVALKSRDCHVVRCPDMLQARSFLRGINYSLLICDDESAGAEMQLFIRSPRPDKNTPVVILKKAGDADTLVTTIKQMLGL
jgi:DNA-binding NtrC family response regulator